MFGSKSVMTKSMPEKTFEKTFSSFKKMKSGKNGKTIEGLKDQFVETNKLGHRTRIQLGRSPSWTSPVWQMAELDRPESVFDLSS
ncbi:hypothetical protein F2Q70_00002819 [Brassica cretica]|uniref:Uncharacterized protein n=1 Tax=Brassica cretica TaxID=69181 RepID=A0A3N6SBG3_BRACR|nr:hypothetical protein F2Q70_00002819 [Brassica cretica]KAF3567761.1 hypothetical protein DY000_02014446 [Brassica cretica]